MQVNDAVTFLSEADIERIKTEALQHFGIGWFSYRFDGTIVSMDQSVFSIFDLSPHYASPEETTGKKLSELVEYISPVALLRKHVREHGHTRGLEWEFCTLNGNYRYTLQDAYIISPPTYQEEMIQVILRDITQRKELEKELDELKQIEEQQKVMMESFGAVCHHFNQPLTVLLGYLSMLKRDLEDQISPNHSKYLKSCLTATEEMSNLIYKLKKIKQYKSIPYNKDTSIVDLEEQV